MQIEVEEIEAVHPPAWVPRGRETITGPCRVAVVVIGRESQVRRGKKEAEVEGERFRSVDVE